jgi:hypothetical protein
MSYFKSIIQDVQPDANNTSTTNLDAGNNYSFTGSSTSTLGVVGLQWSLKTDQNATVYIEQSDDETNWDISYTYNYVSSMGGVGETVQATKAYWRVRVELIEEIATTYFRLSGVLCPIAFPLPSTLSTDGRLSTESTIIGQQNIERHVWVTPTNALSVESPVRLVGTNYDGTTKDTNFWTETVSGSGVVTQAGEIQLDTGVVANSSAKYESVRKARFVVGSALKFQGLYKFVTSGTTDNVRRMGVYTDDDGFFFQLDGQTFSIGTRKSGSDTLVSSGSFNGNIGPNFTPVTTKYYKFEIEWSPKGAFWYVDGKLLHKNGSGHLSNVLTLPITYENVNDNGNSTDVAFDCLGAAIMRLGDLVTNSTYKYIGTDTTTVCKVGAGILHRLIISDNTGSVTIYDNTAASGTIISILDTAQGSEALGSVEYMTPFNDGLTIVTTGGVTMTVVYE